MKNFHAIAVPLLLLITIFVVPSCQTPNEDPKIEQCAIQIKPQLESDVEIEGMLKLTITDNRTTEQKEQPIAPNGATVELLKGTYTLTIEGESKSKAKLFGRVENVQVSDNATVVIPIVAEKNAPKPERLVFEEVFFNGETNNGQMMHPDQYFSVFNNGEETVYLDGIIFAVTAHANPLPKDDFTDLLTSEKVVVVRSLLQFPGNGKNYPLEPGKRIVVAATAINHYDTNLRPNSVDLSGADFEVYFTEVPERFPADIDNPDVPNMKVIFDSLLGTGLMHPRGFMPPCIFRLGKPLDAFLKENLLETTNGKGEKARSYKVPFEWILDAVETGCEGQFAQASFAPELDRGHCFVTGCHRGMNFVRKNEMRNGRKYLIDTNNSTNDFTRIQGQNACPKK